MKIKLSDHFTYRKLIRFVMPSIIMMFFTSFYTVVDGFFVSNYAGKTPFAAINLVLPFLMVLGSVGFMLGTGGSALVSKTLGEGKKEQANRYFTMLVLLSIGIGILFSIVGFILLEPISILLGATEEMMKDCLIYGQITLIFNSAFMLQYLFQTFFVTAEKPKLGLYFTIAAGLGNIVGDYLLVYVFQMGVAGAAIATGINQCIGGLLPILYFARPNKSLLRLTKTGIEWKPMLKACGNGASEFLNNIAGNIVAIAYNYQLLRYAGENGVAAYGVLMYVNFIFTGIFFGYAMGTAPIVGYAYGAGNHQELKNMLKKSLTIIIGVGIVLLGLSRISADLLVRSYVGYDQELFQLTKHAFLIYSLSFLFCGINVYISSFFTALNNGGVSALLSFLRTIVFQLITVIALPRFLGIEGIWYAVTVAEVLCGVVSFYFLISLRHEYKYWL